MRAAISLLFLLALVSCLGTTGSALVTFPAYAAGPAGVQGALDFDTGPGFHVQLTSAKMHIGAVYLTSTALNPSSQSSSCVNPGQYVGQVPGGADIDLLSSTPQPFSVLGNGTANQAQTGELWLTGGDVNADDDPTQIVTLTGIATKGGTSYPFEATVTIGDNRLKPVSDPAQPGLNPICKRRIISGLPALIPIYQGGALLVRIDPRGWFNSVDFSQLDQESMSPPLYTIPDSDNSGTPGEAAGRSLFTGILTGVLPSGESAYSFVFETP